MLNFANCTEEELWVFVATELLKRGIETVLVGGAVVSIYSEGAYRSGDLDLVLKSMFTNRDDLDSAMQEIGFQKQGRHFAHPECSHLFVEFPGTYPIGIGSDYSIQPQRVNQNGVEIQILSPTDSIKDRLAGFAYFKDRDCLDQAILIAKKQQIDLNSIEAWCKNEGQNDVFKEFVELLGNNK